MSRPDLAYRPDIDGLRAIAVLTVVFYHAFPDVLRGGFIGVDIFFVISGYLISSIILDGLSNGRFTFASFYMRRVRRIFPALLLVLTASFVAGAVLLTPIELTQLERQIVAGVGFVSNIVLWKEVGYFDSAAEMKPLLHLWSLGIEEQFYAVWPALLWLALKRRWSTRIVAATVVVISFVINMAMSRHNFLDAFYLPQARMWELAAGAFMVTPASGSKGLESSRLRYLSFVGAFLIVVGLVAISAGQPYPGWRALLPTLGALLMIGPGRASWFNNRILANPAMVAIGLISYPLYLWHWPILVFGRIFARQELSVTTRLVLIAMAFLASFLTYRLVEKPIRFGHSRRRAWNIALPVASVCLVAIAIGSIAIRPTGFAAGKLNSALTEEGRRLTAELAQAGSIKDNFQDLYGDRPCFKYRIDQTVDMFVENGCLTPKNPEKDSVLLLGDSHSASLSLGLRPFVESRNMNLLQVSTGFCEPTSNDLNDKVCVAINREVQKSIATLRPKIAILDSSWIFASQPPYFLGNAGYYRHLLDLVSRLLADGVTSVVVVGQVPAWIEAMPDYLERNFVLKGLPIPDRTYAGVSAEALKMDDIMRSLKYPDGATYLSIRDLLCDDAGCLTHIGPDFATDIVFWDYGHLTPSAARYVVKNLFAPKWTDLTTPVGTNGRQRQ